MWGPICHDSWGAEGRRMLVLNWFSPAPFILSTSLVYGCHPSSEWNHSVTSLETSSMVCPQAYLTTSPCLPCGNVTNHLVRSNLRNRANFWLKSSVYHNGEGMAVRLACRGGNGNRGLLAHILEVQEIQSGCKCQGSPLRDPFPPGRLNFCKVSVSQTQPSSTHRVFKRLSLQRQFTFTQQD